MSSSELSDLETLLLQVIPDPRGYAERIIQQLVDRVTTQNFTSEQPTVIAGYDEETLEVLRDRNLLLAGALGACECWGQDPGCPSCSGMGSAGWTVPDRSLYAEYVQPASQRMPVRDPASDDGFTIQQHNREEKQSD